VTKRNRLRASKDLHFSILHHEPLSLRRTASSPFYRGRIMQRWCSLNCTPQAIVENSGHSKRPSLGLAMRLAIVTLVVVSISFPSQVRGLCRLCGAVDAALEYSIQGGLSNHQKPIRRRRRDSRCVDEGLCSFENFRWKGKVFDLANAYCRQFSA
jgi:hypothetical protein